MYEPMHPMFSCAVKRPGAVAVVGGIETITESAIATLDAGIEDITADVLRSPEGQDVELALRAYTGDVETQWREGDRWTLTYRGVVREFEAVALTGPFGSGDVDHVEIELRAPLRG